MTLTFRALLAVLLLPLYPAISAVAGTGEGVRASLVAGASVLMMEGGSFTATVVLDLQPGWHTYWQYPGDSGIPTTVEWHLPEGWKAGPIEFSLPEQYKEPGDMVIYGYEKQSLLRAVITPPKDLPKNQTYELKAVVSWLACKDLCVPGSAEVSCVVSGPRLGAGNWLSPPVPQGVWPEENPPLFPVSISAKGAALQISFTGEKGADYELFPDPTDKKGEETTVGHVTRDVSGLRVVFTIPWQGHASFHALLVENQGGVRKAWWIGKGLTDTDPVAAHSASPLTATVAPSAPISWGVLIAALFSGFLGGMILNLMPCVLPVISLKIFGFIAQAGESPAKILRHGLAFAAGILVWFLGLGVLVIVLKAGGAQVTWGAFQFQNPLFVLLLSLLVFLFALNLFGVFEIALPGRAGTSLDHAAARGGYRGSFFQGLFATLLATPCTAPFLGSALGFAFAQNSVVILAMFAAVAFGMALPYLLLSARPGWRRWIPKPGVWMERLKQFLGFPLLATNLWLLWVLENQRGSGAALLLLGLFLILGFCAWIYGALAFSAGRWFFPLLAAILLVIGGSLFAVVPGILHGRPAAAASSGQGGIDWVPYTPASLEALRAEGKPVLLDFTASWCLTCQFNERTAINTPVVRQVLKDRGITAMKGDWTNADPSITAALKSFGRVGVPLAVFYPQGKAHGEESEPLVLPELLTEKIVLEALSHSGK